MILSVRKNSLQ